jgi:hypothetical protein
MLLRDFKFLPANTYCGSFPTGDARRRFNRMGRQASLNCSTKAKMAFCADIDYHLASAPALLPIPTY